MKSRISTKIFFAWKLLILTIYWTIVTPLIKKQETRFRESISPGQRLAVTLRFLATGDSNMSLQYIFRIPQPTISANVPEVCEAIFKVLKDDYLKVYRNFSIHTINLNTKMSLYILVSIYWSGLARNRSWLRWTVEYAPLQSSSLMLFILMP